MNDSRTVYSGRTWSEGHRVVNPRPQDIIISGRKLRTETVIGGGHWHLFDELETLGVKGVDSSPILLPWMGTSPTFKTWVIGERERRNHYSTLKPYDLIFTIHTSKSC